MKKIRRARRDLERCEPMEVEFLGGPFDGSKLFVDVVREGPKEFRVLEARYVPRGSGPPASEGTKASTPVEKKTSR